MLSNAQKNSDYETERMGSYAGRQKQIPRHEIEREASLHIARKEKEKVDKKKAEKAEKRNEKREKQEEQGERKSSGLVSNIAKAFNIMACFRAMNLMEDMPFFNAFIFAVVKDILDGVFAGLAAASAGLLVPLAMIMCWVLSALCSIFIFIELLMVRASENRKTANKMATKAVAKIAKSKTAQKWIIRFVVLVTGGLLDSMPLLSVIPIETLTVLIIYILTLADRANEAADEKNG